MITLPKLQDLNVAGKKVLVRADLDVESTGFESDLRIVSLTPTLDYLKEKGAQIILLGHKGRPEGDSEKDKELSLEFLKPYFAKWGAEVAENLRFDPGEEKNDPEFAKKLASLGDIYVNEAFAASHREHASIVGIPKLLPHAVGLRFASEVENLSKLFENPAKPVVVVIGGAKEDKANYIEDIASFADKILVGGRLPLVFGDESLKSVSLIGEDEVAIYANLIPDREDITISSIERFEKEIAKAGTILLAGPMGKYEEEGHLMGTKRVFDAAAASPAFKIAGGGDTIKAVGQFGLTEKFDWVSVGGGAMLEFVTKKTLPGIATLQ